MLDRIVTTCHKCGKEFETWLLRGECAPALCLGCWFHAPSGAGPVPSQAREPDMGPLEVVVIAPDEPGDPTVAGPAC